MECGREGIAQAQWVSQLNPMRPDKSSQPVLLVPKPGVEPRKQVEESGRWLDASILGWNVCLDELRQQRERFLPPQVAGFGRDDLRYPFLHDVQLGTR